MKKETMTLKEGKEGHIVSILSKLHPTVTWQQPGMCHPSLLAAGLVHYKRGCLPPPPSFTLLPSWGSFPFAPSPVAMASLYFSPFSLSLPSYNKCPKTWTVYWSRSPSPQPSLVSHRQSLCASRPSLHQARALLPALFPSALG